MPGWLAFLFWPALACLVWLATLHFGPFRLLDPTPPLPADVQEWVLPHAYCYYIRGSLNVACVPR